MGAVHSSRDVKMSTAAVVKLGAVLEYVRRVDFNEMVPSAVASGPLGNASKFPFHEGMSIPHLSHRSLGVTIE
jgi:hypothetical protein